MEVITNIFSSKSDDECLKKLDAWIEPIKKNIHEKNIKGPNNTPVVLENFINAMKNEYNKVYIAITNKNEQTRDSMLKSFGWPDDLINCTKDVTTRTDVIDRLKLWCNTYTLNADLLTRQTIHKEII